MCSLSLNDQSQAQLAAGREQRVKCRVKIHDRVINRQLAIEEMPECGNQIQAGEVNPSPP